MESEKEGPTLRHKAAQVVTSAQVVTILGLPLLSWISTASSACIDS